MSTIHLPPESTAAVAEKLQVVLGSYEIMLSKVQGFHWNMKGKAFFPMHKETDDLYNAIFVVIDEIAERIRMIGYNPSYTHTSFLEHSVVEDVEIPTNIQEGITAILKDIEAVIEVVREIISFAQDEKDEGTADLLIGKLRHLEKVHWMFGAYVG